MSSDIFFPGVVALVNSLRLAGHDEPIFLLDLGMRPEQRELVEAETTVIPAPRDTAPYLLKTYAPLRHPADAQVLIDADMVATRSLAGLIRRAADGRVVAFENNDDRFVPEWGDVLDLGPVPRRRYLSSGLVFLGGSAGRETLRLLDDRQRRVDFDRSYFGRDDIGYPLRFLDQDVLNAVVAARIPVDRVVVLDNRLAPNPPFTGLRMIDEQAVRCGYADGVEPYVVHHHTVKPWLAPTHHGIYSRLLRRLLLGRDVAVRLPETWLPLRLRTGLLAGAERTRVNIRESFRWRVTEPLSARLGRAPRGIAPGGTGPVR